MSFWGPFDASIQSTQMGVVSNPTTATLIAEVDFNDTMATAKAGGQPYQVGWIVGVQTTLATFLLEHSASTGLDMSTAAQSTRTGAQTVVMVSSGQSAQFVTKHTIFPGNRLRIRVNSSFTGGVAGTIFAEPMA